MISARFFTLRTPGRTPRRPFRQVRRCGWQKRCAAALSPCKGIFGKPLWGILCLLVSILSTVLGLFPLMFLIVLGGMVFAILIGAGKVKDKDGKYIVSEKQKQSLLHGER